MASSDVKRSYRGTFVHTPGPGQLELLEDHIVSVDEHGIISSVSPSNAASQIQAEVETLPSGSFALPLFVDTHIHAPQYLYAGTALDRPLMEWLTEYAFKAEKRIDADLSLARRVYGTLAKRLIECGTGCVSAFGTVGVDANVVLVEELLKAGVRGQVGKVSMDRNSPPDYCDPSTDEAISRARTFAEKVASMEQKLVSPVLTPRFIPTCTPRLMSGLLDLSNELNLAIQTHACESLEEVDFTKSLENGEHDIDVLQAAGYLTSRTLLAHCTHLEDGHTDTLIKAGASVAHCPLSNLYFSTRIFETHEALGSHLKFGIGSDIAGGYRLDLGDAMRSAVAVSRARDGVRREAGGLATADASLAITWKDAIYVATQGGARALNLDNVIGTFAPGKAFDAQLIHPGATGQSQVDLFDKPPLEQLVERWFCCGDRMDRVKVWTQGQVRFERKT